ncbi:bifunctional response regulator/alkaline phosphatase family protein [Taibaiella lutea]|uniref:Bifunctional response regulator/alkaline phosphatase family protein n=1 Tax=Taibaiella lutea TaxID=2608001 RepID=A0A5M6CB31_9BACT|nr:response regulator [Taibaiella lutea]KAA5532386.1 bifunctional response regulator/alkaline phosphatase family protein [Taibaiella lutea]
MQAEILWVDDEIESLKSQILFLKNKGYEIIPFTNGYDALEHLKANPAADLVLLDESMPGMTGLETLAQIKETYPTVPVVMVTKNEAENIMEEAIGSQITDYLIKPVNPNQVLLSIKKILDGKRLVSEKTTLEYQKDFRNLFMALNNNPSVEEWKELYKKLVYWEVEMAKSDSPEMQEVFNTQKQEANTEFFKFVSRYYTDWIQEKKSDTPIMSHTLFEKRIAPQIKKGKPTFMVLIDNLRYDQWKSIEPIITQFFRVQEEEMFYSILPTSTQYSRNAIFSGLLPVEIEKTYPLEWKNDDEQGGKNLYEKQFLGDHLRHLKMGNIKWDYLKITNNEDGKNMEDNIHNYLRNDLTVIVYNFVDMLSHARTEMEVLKELAGDEVSYRSLTVSWFEHSPLYRALKKIADKDIQLIITTDHGTMRVKTPSKCVGDKTTTTNLRYKHGRNIQYEEKDVFAITNPHEAGLPQPNVNSKYIFAKGDVFLCYPNNYNHYVNYYRNTFQHGGVSLEEVIVPLIRLTSK